MNAIFLKLLNMSAAGSVLILAVVVLRALLKRAPRWIICVMWAVVAVRLVCPVSIVSPLSAFQATPSIVSESGEVEVFRPAGGSEKPLLAVDTVQIERPRANAETITEIPGTSLAVTQRSRDTYLPPLMQGYLLGLAVMLLYALISTLLLRKKVSVSLRQRGNIRLCDEVASPFILGIFRPVIYLPSSLSEEEKRFVLAHERAHLRRLDYIWKPVGFLILSLHWFNPFCWLAYVLLCRDIELACDEKVIRELGHTERAAYSQTLLNCSAHRILAACPVAFGETDVKTRVKAVLNYKKPAFWIILAAVLACIVLIVCFAANPIQEQDLSFLNYKNAISLIGQNDTAPYANLYPADSDGVQPGVADAKALAQFLSSAEWTKRRAPSSSPEPRGWLEFVIEDDYRIIVYQSERLAAVRFGNDIRYYRIGAGDYEAALGCFIPAPSTEPDRKPEQTFDNNLILSDPLGGSIPGMITDDASELLTSMFTPTAGYLLKKGFPAAGQMQSTLYHTLDGQTWTQVREIHDDVHNFPKLLYFWNQNDGIILTDYHGYSDCVYRTQDGGITWKPVVIEFPPEDSAILSGYSYLEGENVQYEAGLLIITLSAHFESRDSHLFTVRMKDGTSSSYFDDMGSELVLSNDNGKTCNVSFGVYKVSWFGNTLGEYNPDTGVLHFSAQDVDGKSVSAEVRTEDGHLVVTITDWDYEEFLPNGTELVFYKTA